MKSFLAKLIGAIGSHWTTRSAAQKSFYVVMLLGLAHQESELRAAMGGALDDSKKLSDSLVTFSHVLASGHNGDPDLKNLRNRQNFNKIRNELAGQATGNTYPQIREDWVWQPCNARYYHRELNLWSNGSFTVTDYPDLECQPKDGCISELLYLREGNWKWSGVAPNYAISLVLKKTISTGTGKAIGKGELLKEGIKPVAKELRYDARTKNLGEPVQGQKNKTCWFNVEPKPDLKLFDD